MVIEDTDFKINPVRRGLETEHWLAEPMDRLSAAIIDLVIVLSPVVLFVISPFKQMALEKYLLGESTLFPIVMAILFASLVVVAYQTYLVFRYGFTVGKWFMGLKVINVWTGAPVDFGSSLSRAFFWLLEVVFLGIPHLAVLTNSRRRPWHDRLADTQVISVRANARAPSARERAFASGILTALFVLSGFQVLLPYESYEQDVANDECRSEPLEVAIDRLAAKTIDPNCVEQEADRELMNNGDLSLAYLAKALVFANDHQIAKAYINKVCSLDEASDSCKMGQALNMLFKNPGSEQTKTRMPASLPAREEEP